MDKLPNIDLVYKIVLPIVAISLSLLSGIIGYFGGIRKERASIKWKEQREALRKTYDLIQHMTQYIHSGVPDQELTELKDKGKDIIYNEASVLNENISKEFNALIAIFLSCEGEKSRETAKQKVLFLEKAQELSKKIKKELK